VLIGLQHRVPGGSPQAAVSGRLEQASRALTLLDVWSQLLVPTVLLQHAQAHALRIGDVGSATLLEGKIRHGLLQVEGFEEAAHDGALRNPRSSDVRAIRAAAAAWHDWASALLWQQSFLTPSQRRHVAELEAKAMRLHQAAYAAIDASFRVAVATR
jgi:hypothetical protein